MSIRDNLKQAAVVAFVEYELARNKSRTAMRKLTPEERKEVKLRAYDVAIKIYAGEMDPDNWTEESTPEKEPGEAHRDGTEDSATPDEQDG